MPTPLAGQDAVLSRSFHDHASARATLRVHSHAPLEIDAMAPRALETMPDVVAAVTLDRSLKPQ